jgi:outer membrane protein OmpA-like peptidoglycan-associated protein
MRLPRFSIVYAQVLALEVLVLGGSWSLWSRTYASAAGMVAPPIARKVVVHGVTFDRDGVSISADAEPLLREAAETLSDDEPTTLVVSGERGNPIAPDALSRLADAVRDYLVEHGVEASSVHVSGAVNTCGLASEPTHPCVMLDIG